MRKILFLLIALTCLVSCKTVQQTGEQVVYRDRIVYQDKLVHDSIYQKEIEKEYVKGDTVYRDLIRYKYIEKTVHDTTLVSRTDTVSIYKEKIIFDHKQTGVQKFFMITGILVVLSVFVYLCYLLLKKQNFLH